MYEFLKFCDIWGGFERIKKRLIVYNMVKEPATFKPHAVFFSFFIASVIFFKILNII